jgi:hypothetical protein
MIALSADFLMLTSPNGESIPVSPEMVTIELGGAGSELFDDEFLRHASNAVFHYFKHELGRQIVSIGEFTGALEKVLRGFALNVRQPAGSPPGVHEESDLVSLAAEADAGCELFFFTRLREEVRTRLKEGPRPRLLRFYGLRGCVKQLSGARRWTLRCREMEERVLEYLRHCLSAEAGEAECSLVVR